MTTELEQALEAFIISDDFDSAVIDSTKASWSGSTYKVELFPNGTYRILWSNEIGNRYETDGIILTVPALNDEDYDNDEDLISDALGYRREELQDELRTSLKEASYA